MDSEKKILVPSCTPSKILRACNSSSVSLRNLAYRSKYQFAKIPELKFGPREIDRNGPSLEIGMKPHSVSLYSGERDFSAACLDMSIYGCQQAASQEPQPQVGQ